MAAARALVPKSLRFAIRSRVEKANQKKYSTSRDELNLLNEALYDDRTKCVAEPTIPTMNWRFGV